MCNPFGFRVCRGFDGLQSLIPQMFNALANPVHVLFDGDQHIAQHRRAAGAGNREEIRKALHLQAEIGNRSVAPLIAQGLAVAATDVRLQQCARHRIKACGVDQHVEVVVAFAGLNSGCGNRLEWSFKQVHQRNIVAIEGVVEIPIEHLALATDAVGFRQQPFGHCRIIDHIPHRFAIGFVRDLVRFHVGEHVPESQQHPQTPLSYQLGPLFGSQAHDLIGSSLCGLRGGLLERHRFSGNRLGRLWRLDAAERLEVRYSAGIVLLHIAYRAIVVAELLLDFGAHTLAICRYGIDGGALQHREMLRLSCEFGNCLHAG